MSLQITRLTDFSLRLGEGPHWDEKAKALYFVDIQGSTIHKYDPETNVHTFAKVGEKEVSLIIPIENEKNKFLITYGCDIATITWDGVSKTVNDFSIRNSVEGYPEVRINDGKVSPSGVLFAGTMEKNLLVQDYDREGYGKLYAVVNKKVKTLLSGIVVANGLAWSSDEKRFFYIDSVTRKVDAFDYNSNVVEISNRKTIFDFEENNIEGYPDGMTIDTNGNLWVACYRGGCILNINPNDGTLLSTIKLPAPEVTSVTFGGPNLEDLFVTSSTDTLTDEQKRSYPYSGCLFKISGTGSRGLPGVAAKF